MNKYLEKIAASNDKHDPYDIHPRAALGAFTLGAIASTPVSLAGMHVGTQTRKSIDDPKHSNSDLGTVKKFLRDNKLNKTTTFNLREHHLDKLNMKGETGSILKSFAKHIDSPMMFDSGLYGGHGKIIAGVRASSEKYEASPMGYKGPKTRSIHNKDIIMHELGHAKDFSHNGAAKRFMMAISRGQRSQTAFGVASAAMLSNEKTRDYAPAVAAIPGVSVMREELAANYHAYKGIKAHKGSAHANKFLKHVAGKNTLNYGLTMAAPVVAAYVGKKIMEHWHPAKSKENAK